VQNVPNIQMLEKMQNGENISPAKQNTTVDKVSKLAYSKGSDIYILITIL
jgi:hypothetical protein